MGLVFTKIEFKEEVPPLSDICTAIENISGLAVVSSEYDIVASGYMHAGIAFECEKQSLVELRWHKREHSSGNPPINNISTPEACTNLGIISDSETKEKTNQTVSLSTHMGQEGTLLNVTMLALESLGGKLIDQISDNERRKYGNPISESELQNRIRKNRRKNLLPRLVIILMQPILIPVYILYALLAVLVVLLIAVPVSLWFWLKPCKEPD